MRGATNLTCSIALMHTRRSLDRSWTDKALLVKEKFDTQFFDSLLLVAAEENGCDTILTEDLNDGQMYGTVKAVNPFR